MLSQEISDRDARLQQQEDLQRRDRELQQGIETGQAQIAALHDEITARQAERKRIADRQERLAADAQGRAGHEHPALGRSPRRR